jgi:hypothetical protein
MHTHWPLNGLVLQMKNNLVLLSRGEEANGRIGNHSMVAADPTPLGKQME